MSKQNKFTPGPWSFVPKAQSPSNTWVYIYQESSSTKIAESMFERDARLIAAAPDCLSACEIVLTNLEAMQPAMVFHHEFDRLTYKACLDAVKAAIAKATGGAE